MLDTYCQLYKKYNLLRIISSNFSLWNTQFYLKELNGTKCQNMIDSS